MNPKQRPNMTTKREFFYLHRETIFKLTKKYHPQRLDKVLSKYLKPSKSVREIEDHYNELSKYSKSPSEVIIAERVKLKKNKKTKENEKTKSRNRNQNIKSKHTIHQTSSIISTNKS